MNSFGCINAPYGNRASLVSGTGIADSILGAAAAYGPSEAELAQMVGRKLLSGRD